MRPSVLLVDDDPSILEGLSRVFRQSRYDVLVAENAKMALRVLETCSVDVVVSDEAMPGMPGTAFLAQVRTQYPETIRIVLTGKGNFAVAMRAINEGEVYRFFTKPCDSADVAIAIRQALQQKALLHDSRRLLQTVRRQAAIMEDLEDAMPGITYVKRDLSGAVLLDQVPMDIDELLKEVEAELEMADKRLSASGDGSPRRETVVIDQGSKP